MAAKILEMRISKDSVWLCITTGYNFSLVIVLKSLIDIFQITRRPSSRCEWRSNRKQYYVMECCYIWVWIKTQYWMSHFCLSGGLFTFRSYLYLLMLAQSDHYARDCESSIEFGILKKNVVVVVNLFCIRHCLRVRYRTSRLRGYRSGTGPLDTKVGNRPVNMHIDQTSGHYWV